MSSYVNHYHNPTNGRQYHLELTQDLLGDWVVCKYFGHQRRVHAKVHYQEAYDYFMREHRRRLSRHYRQVFFLRYVR